MKTKKFIFLLLVPLLLSVGCNKDDEIDSITQILPLVSENISYSFFVAGHTSGSSQNHIYGLHSPFVHNIPFINNYPKMDVGVLTGDVVPQPTVAFWDSAQTTINKFNVPIHIAAGNHDKGNEFLTRFNSYYYHFTIQNDLFIILSPTKWNIEGKQKEFLVKTIQENQSSTNNIFIFCHELIWWDPNNKFGNIKINYRPHYPGSTNYYSEIKPILDTLPNQVVLFAGDLGNTATVDAYMYHKEDNITLIASGMGSGVNDNIIIVDVNNDGSLNYNLLGINIVPPHGIAKLEDFVLP